MEDTDLEVNFAVCFDHFQNNEQYKTPVGSTDHSPNGNESESIEVVETPSNTFRGPLQESTISSASTNNTDICVLDSHYACEDLQFLPDDAVEFVESEEGDEVFLREIDVMDKNEEFTVLQKPTKARRLCNCEESTEVLLLISSDYQEKRKHTYSGTDSDVEILMSEEIVESDWSSGNGLVANRNLKPLSMHVSNGFKESIEHEVTSPSYIQQSSECNSLPREESTDLDVSGDELADAAVTSMTDMYQNYNRVQLLELIQQQELRIQALEDTVERYHKAQQRLFEHVDALRLELNEIRISPLHHNDTLGKKHDAN